MRLKRRTGPEAELEAEPEMAEEVVSEAGEGDEDDGYGFMPSPQAAAVAIMALLAFGTIIGSVTNPLAQSAGVRTILLSRSPAPAPEPSAPAAAEPEPVVAAAPAPAPAAPAAVPATPAAPEAAPEEPEPTTTPPPAKIEIPPVFELPPVSHVFLIVLGDQGYNASFGTSAHKYLSKTLPAEGELLPNYYAVAQGDLANEVALVSGQGPTPQTAEDCPEYTDVSPGTVGETAEQVAGAGCVYPAPALTLPGQLAAAGDSWKAYVEGVEAAAPAQPASCRHPALGSLDADSLPLPGDAYETWRNPFVYFHSLIDAPECGERDVGLGALQEDLKSAAKTPSLSYIVPDACHDGSELPCEPGQPAGIAAAEPSLEKVVGEIQASAAYKEGGLIAITFAQAPQAGPSADPSACCGTPEYPNLGPPAAAPAAPGIGGVTPTGGGGKVGMLLLSPFVQPGSVDESDYFNDYSTLRSIEELFSLTPLGYAGEPAVSGFGETVYDNAESSASAVPSGTAQSSRISNAVSTPSRIPPTVSARSAQPGGS